jgi:hypothetical protein
VSISITRKITSDVLIIAMRSDIRVVIANMIVDDNLTERRATPAPRNGTPYLGELALLAAKWSVELASHSISPMWRV